MRVKIETACFWGEGDSRKRYEAGSVIDVPEDVQALNAEWMKPTEEALKEAPAPKAGASAGVAAPDGDKS